MGTVTTILGEMDAGSLGFVDMHTHLLLEWPEDMVMEWPADAGGEQPKDERALPLTLENLHELRRGYWGFSDVNFKVNDPHLLREELRLFKEAGGNTLVDGSPRGLRGDVVVMQELARELGINIVLSTGLYGEGLWPPECVAMDERELVDYILGEIRDGIDGTGIRPGQVKMACNKFSEAEQRGLRAGAAVAKSTGMSYQVHTGGAHLSPEYTLRMAEILKTQGMPMDKVVFLHMDQFVAQTDLLQYVTNHEKASQLILDPLRRVLDTGATIGFDCFGTHESKEIFCYVNASDYDRLAALYTLIQEGYSSQIILATDVSQRLYYRQFGGAGYLRVLELVIPVLRRAGVSQRDLENLTHRNAARLLAVN